MFLIYAIYFALLGVKTYRVSAIGMGRDGAWTPNPSSPGSLKAPGYEGRGAGWTRGGRALLRFSSSVPIEN